MWLNHNQTLKQTVLWSRTWRNISSALAQPGFLLGFRKVYICKGKGKKTTSSWMSLRSKPVPGWAFSSGYTEVRDFSWDNTACVSRRQSWAEAIQPELSKKDLPTSKSQSLTCIFFFNSFPFSTVNWNSRALIFLHMYLLLPALRTAGHASSAESPRYLGWE